jgi:hypothetical protein
MGKTSWRAEQEQVVDPVVVVHLALRYHAPRTYPDELQTKGT